MRTRTASCWRSRTGTMRGTVPSASTRNVTSSTRASSTKPFNASMGGGEGGLRGGSGARPGDGKFTSPALRIAAARCARCDRSCSITRAPRRTRCIASASSAAKMPSAASHPSARGSVRENSAFNPAASKPSAHSTPGADGTRTRAMPSRSAKRTAMQRPGATERHQGEIARIVSALHRDHADRADHVGIGNRQDAARRLMQRQSRAVRRLRRIARSASPGSSAMRPPSSDGGRWPSTRCASVTVGCSPPAP